MGVVYDGTAVVTRILQEI